MPSVGTGPQVNIMVLLVVMDVKVSSGGVSARIMSTHAVSVGTVWSTKTNAISVGTVASKSVSGQE